MNSTHIISQDVFDKIRSRFTNLEMGDEQGEVTSDPKEARFFDFDFVVEGNNLGRVSISINETGALKLFYSQGILEETDDFIHQLWYDFLREMRMFAKRRLLRFDTRDITKSNLDKTDFQYLANTGSKETEMNMSESVKFEGGKMTSRRVLEKAVLIAKHHTPISDESYGARSRKNNIKALYIENADGERYKFPFIYIAGAKAMQRHVANGGRPYDEVGQHIVGMCETIAQLTAYRKHIGGHDGMNQEVNEITERANMKLQTLRRQMESMCGQPGYESWKESISPMAGEPVEMDQATMEDYKSKFTVSSFREDLTQYFPLLHSIMQETGTVDLEDFVSEGDECKVCKEDPCQCDDDDLEEHVNTQSINFDTFESWANRVAEGKLGMDQIGELDALLQQGLTLDTEGSSAIEALQGIGIHDDELEDALVKLAEVNPQADPKDTILAWLATDDPEAAKELGYQGGKEAPVADAPEADEDSVDGDTDKQEMNKAITPRAVAEVVFSMYNRNHKEEGLGPFPKGSTGVVTHITKEMGPQAGVLAEKLVAAIEKEAGVVVDGINEEVEDRTSYKVARFLFDKGVRYNPQNEKQIINKMDDAMIAMNMPAKTIQYLLRHDKDFLGDTLGELRSMEQAVDEVANEGTPVSQTDIKARAAAAFADMDNTTMDSPSDAATQARLRTDLAAGKGTKIKDMNPLDRDQYLKSTNRQWDDTTKTITPIQAPVPTNEAVNQEFDRIRKLAGLAK